MILHFAKKWISALIQSFEKHKISKGAALTSHLGTVCKTVDDQNLCRPSEHSADADKRDGYYAKLFVVGPISLTDATGQNRTPRSKKAVALLALLALAPRRQRTRVWLRDKLWSESDERKSSTSLRQVIFELRRDLGGLFDAIIALDRHTITLKDDRLWIDYIAVQQDVSQMSTLNISPDTTLLEGIDIRDEEFENWLLLERQTWVRKSEQLIAARDEAPVNVPQKIDTRQVTVQPTQRTLRISVGILPNIQQGCDTNTAHVADNVLEGIAKNLCELHPLDIYDFRDSSAHSDALAGASDTDYYIRVRALQIRESLTLTFFFYQATRMSLEWSQSIQTSVADVLDWDSYVISGFVTQNVDRISKSITDQAGNIGTHLDQSQVAGYTALNMMFRLDRMALNNAEQLLSSTRDTQNSALFSALRAYSASFKIGENLGIIDATTVSDTVELAQDAQNKNPFNAISLACLGHTMGYVFRDHAMAGALIERALNLNRNQAFVWDHYALHKLYTGDYKAAHSAAQRAVYLGSYSPISYSYDTTLAMTATMLGDHRKAIVSSQNALKKQPKFSAAMRYLLVNLSDTGRMTEAADVYHDLLRIDPDFGDPSVQKERFRLGENPKEADFLEAIKRCSH